MKRILTAILFIATPFWGVAQNSLFERADSLYGIGIQTFRQHEYRRAEALFLQCDSLNRAAERPAPYFSSNAIQWASHACYKEGDMAQAVRLDSILYRIPPVDQRLTMRSDSLFFAAERYASQGDWEDALRLIRQGEAEEKRVLGEEHYYCANTAAYIGFCYWNLGQLEEAAEYTKRALLFWQKHEEACLDIEHLYNDLHLIYTDMGDCKRALDVDLQALEHAKRQTEGDRTNIVLALSNTANSQACLGNYEAAVSLGKEALELCRELLPETDPNTLILMSNLKDYYVSQGDYPRAIEITERILALQKKLSLDQEPDYPVLLNDLGRYYASVNNYDKAIELTTQALNRQREFSGEQDPNRVLLLNSIGQYHYDLGRYDKAFACWSESLNLCRQLFEESHPIYVQTLNLVGSYYYARGDYDKAIETATQALNALEKGPKEARDQNYALVLNNLGQDYFAIGQLDKATEFGERALAVQKETLGEQHPNYAAALNNLAQYYGTLGNYEKAIELDKQAMEACRRLLGEKSSDYLRTLNNLGQYYAEIGQYDKAIETGEQVLRIQRQISDKPHPDYVMALNNLGHYYAMIGNYDRAIELNNKARSVQYELYGNSHPTHATLLNNLGQYYFAIGNYEKSLELSQQALEIRKELYGGDHPDIAISLNCLGLAYYAIGELNKALELSTQALEMQTRLFGNSHPTVATTLGNRSFYAFQAGDWEQCLADYERCLRIVTKNTRQDFQYLTARDREAYWSSRRAYFDAAISFNAQCPTPELWAPTSYDVVLLSKGILLASEVEFGRLIRQSGNSELLETYERLRHNRTRLGAYNEKPIAERPQQIIDSLESENEHLERALMTGSRQYGDFTRRLSVRWQDVQCELGEHDIAVEIATTQMDPQKRYLALVLRKGWEAPKSVILCTEDELKPYVKEGSGCYESRELSERIWRPIIEAARIEAGETIYFAADGLFYQLAIEYLPARNGRTIFETYHLFRLSSTKELCFRREAKTTPNSVALYGGLQYELDAGTMEAERKKYAVRGMERDRTVGALLSGIGSDSLKRSMIGYLPGTLAEVKAIARSLDDKAVEYRLFTAGSGTEESFKYLSGRAPGTLHIATHGFYLPPTESERAVRTQPLLQLSIQERMENQLADYSMNRTGLLLSGAESAWMGHPVPDGADDGILTAREIAQMDLQHTGLAVLSACQTGLGEITGDGVAGLQRGFKKAGVKSLIISLWNVDDNATRLLMARFYENLVNGHSKQDAFHEAISYLRNYEVSLELEVDDTSQEMVFDGALGDYVYPKKRIRTTRKIYDSPKFWAAFILLDGLE